MVLLKLILIKLFCFFAGINVENLSIDHDVASLQENKIPKYQVFVSNKSDQLTKKLFECVNKETKFAKRK